jgi:hypothetical protein
MSRDIPNYSIQEIDAAVGRVAQRRRNAGENYSRETIIAVLLSKSREVMEWAEMIYEAPMPHPVPELGLRSKFLSALAIGVEIGFELGKEK